MADRPDCRACHNGSDLHDHTATALCPHAFDNGEPRPCCRAFVADRDAIRQQLGELVNGGGPRTPAALTFDDDFAWDPVGAVWALEDAERGPVSG